jgi:hypothetical protein
MSLVLPALLCTGATAVDSVIPAGFRFMSIRCLTVERPMIVVLKALMPAIGDLARWASLQRVMLHHLAPMPRIIGDHVPDAGIP